MPGPGSGSDAYLSAHTFRRLRQNCPQFSASAWMDFTPTFLWRLYSMQKLIRTQVWMDKCHGKIGRPLFTEAAIKTVGECTGYP
jgi:hypothetical protein